MVRIISLALCLFTHYALAELTKVEINEKTAFEFNNAKYESISGYFHFHFDPSQNDNQLVTDIEFAPIDENGRVAAKASFYLIQPFDKAVRGTLFEISNRGSKASLRYFNQAPRSVLPSSAEALGDGLIQDLGLSMLWVGWQADVPVNKDTMHVELPVADGIEGLVRSGWTLEENTSELLLSHRAGIEVIYPFDKESSKSAYLTKRQSRNGQKTIIDSDVWTFNENGTAIIGDFTPGIYELVYPSKNPLVVGLSLAILRDTAEYLKSDESQFPTSKVIGFGVSQTGRLLRHFLYQGFNQTESGNAAFDGMLIHTAGAGRGSFNHRFGQPSRDAHRFSAFFYPTDLFPFTSRATKHPITGQQEGLADKQSAASTSKVFYTNTGYEYWGRAASLIHTSSQSDVMPLQNERIYHLASGQHFVERRQNLREVKDGVFVGNPLDFLTNLRALLKALTEWVVDEVDPPESKFPTFNKGELVVIDKYRLPDWLQSLQLPTFPHTAYLSDYGQRWQDGIVDVQPPRLLAEIIPAIPNVDKWGNEIGGLRHPFIDEPLAAYLPWAIRNQGFAPDEMIDFRGTLVLMDKSDVLMRYKNWEDYSSKLNVAIDSAISRKELLPRDRDRLMEQADWLWQKVMSNPTED